jgi:hypothetical protein
LRVEVWVGRDFRLQHLRCERQVCVINIGQ